MASRFPRGYGGDGLAEQPKIHHSNLNIKSTLEEPLVIHWTPLQGNMLLTIKDKTFSILKTIMEGSNQIVRYVYYSYYPHYSHEEEDQLVTKQLKQSKSVTYEPKVIKEYMNEKKNLFKILQNCYTVANNELGLIAVEYNWMERHLKLEQGLNLLADCKNCDCEHFMQGVVCPRGMFRDRNGYCPLDMEMYKAKCPTCKQKISPDESFGFGFYNCDFQITYKLVEQKEYRMRQEGRENVFYFRNQPKKETIYMNIELVVSSMTIPTKSINQNHPNYFKTPRLPELQLRKELFPTTKYVPHINEEFVDEEYDIFEILQNCYTVANNELGLIAVEYNWMERHLKLEQGLNLLADCKNCDCEHFMQGVVCPRGMFRDRNGYCPLDMEMYKAKCPTCKQKISPDESFGFGFYDCDFQITYKLFQQKEYRMRQEGSGNIFYFRKLSVLANLFEYLEAQISICTFV